MNLSTWMRVVGIWYLLNFLLFLPPLMRMQLPLFFPDFQAPLNSPQAQAVIDAFVLIALMCAALGIALIAAARHASRCAFLVYVVALFEIIPGIGWDIYALFQGAGMPALFVVIMIVHTTIVLTGFLSLRRLNVHPSV